jgi:DNA polymerase V
MRRHVIALVDCISFYTSVERVFNASLHDKAVVVLSNNDGTIVAASAEAKAVGLKRGMPYFQCRGMIKQHHVAVYSSNYTLYQEMSDRVMRLLADFAAVRNGICQQEVYSIDECFLDLSHVAPDQLVAYAQKVKSYILQTTGIPVRLGIAPTRVLAKVAALRAKDDLSAHDVVSLVGLSEQELDALLATIDVGDIWGIGKQFAQRLEKEYIFTAEIYKYLPPGRARKLLGVVGERIALELRGISCLPLESHPKPKKQICVSRSFAGSIERREELAEAVACYTARAAEKLRKQEIYATCLSVFVGTNPFDQEAPYYGQSASKRLLYPTDVTPDLIQVALELLTIVYRSGYCYKRAGITLTNLQPNTMIQLGLFDEYSMEQAAKNARLMAIIDVNNALYGRDTLFFATQGFQRAWQAKAQWLSQAYTTRWTELLTVR